MVVGICTLALMLAVPASAHPPTIIRGAGEFDISFGPEVCGFAIEAHIRTKAQTIVDASGDPLRGTTTGQLFATLTNQDSGFSRTFAIPGPSFFDATGTLVRGTGTWITFTADGSFVLAAGNMAMDAEGTILAIRGQTFDLCDLMS